MRFMKSACALATVLCLGGVLVGTAGADPIRAPTSSVFTINCGTSGTYNVVVNGNGSFTPAHDLNSNKVLIPVAFGPFSFTVTDRSGTVVDSGIEPGSSKGSAVPKGHPLLSCSYSVSFTDQGGFTFSGSGGVTGYIV